MRHTGSFIRRDEAFCGKPAEVVARRGSPTELRIAAACGTARALRNTLRRLNRECENHASRFVVAFFPGHAEVDEALTFDTARIRGQTACRQAIVACAHELSLEAIDLLPYFCQAGIEATSGDWQVILASLKSLLETGGSLEATRRWPEGV